MQVMRIIYTYTWNHHFLDVFNNPTPHVTFTNSFSRPPFPQVSRSRVNMARGKNLKLFCASSDTSHLSDLYMYAKYVNAHEMIAMICACMHIKYTDLFFRDLLEVHHSITDKKSPSFISDYSLLYFTTPTRIRMLS